MYGRLISIRFCFSFSSIIPLLFLHLYTLVSTSPVVLIQLLAIDLHFRRYPFQKSAHIYTYPATMQILALLPIVAIVAAHNTPDEPTTTIIFTNPSQPLEGTASTIYTNPTRGPEESTVSTTYTNPTRSQEESTVSTTYTNPTRSADESTYTTIYTNPTQGPEDGLQTTALTNPSQPPPGSTGKSFPFCCG